MNRYQCNKSSRSTIEESLALLLTSVVQIWSGSREHRQGQGEITYNVPVYSRRAVPAGFRSCPAGVLLVGWEVKRVLGLYPVILLYRLTVATALAARQTWKRSVYVYIYCTSSVTYLWAPTRYRSWEEQVDGQGFWPLLLPPPPPPPPPPPLSLSLFFFLIPLIFPSSQQKRLWFRLVTSALRFASSWQTVAWIKF